MRACVALRTALLVGEGMVASAESLCPSIAPPTAVRRRSHGARRHRSGAHRFASPQLWRFGSCSQLAARTARRSVQSACIHADGREAIGGGWQTSIASCCRQRCQLAASGLCSTAAHREQRRAVGCEGQQANAAQLRCSHSPAVCCALRSVPSTLSPSLGDVAAKRHQGAGAG